jgi:STE24 endopeptidase
MNLALACLLLVLIQHGFEALLLLIQGRHQERLRASMPSHLQGLFSAQDYAKAIDYAADKNCLALASQGLSLLGVLALLCLAWDGTLAWALALASSHGLTGLALFVLLPLLALSLLDWPLDYARQFGVEQRHGFNKSRPSLWLADKLKGLALAAGLGFLVLWALLALAQGLGQSWWLWGFGFLALVQVFLMLAWPRFIMPLFNRFTPLPEGPLKEQLLGLASRTGFGVAGLFVMDGSRRSSHANAFFTGFGRFRRIVLFDTLVEQLAPEQTAAVLAHEIGHSKRGHTLQGLALSLAGTLGLAYAAHWLSLRCAPLGIGQAGLAWALLALAVLGPSLLYWLSPLSAALSRRWEYQADAFAQGACGAEPLCQALAGLHKSSLGNPVPHPLLVAFHYSHPPVPERLRALRLAEQAKV